MDALLDSLHEVIARMRDVAAEGLGGGELGASSDGEMARSGSTVLVSPVRSAAFGDRVGRDLVLTAEAVLAAEARGEGPDAAPPACADLLRLQALVDAQY